MKYKIKELPADGSLPILTGWRYLHTPGHAPDHISLFRGDDKVLIAGDAFVTTKQESAFAVMIQKKQLSGPFNYFTNDRVAAAASVRQLAGLHPAIATTGYEDQCLVMNLTGRFRILLKIFKC